MKLIHIKFILLFAVLLVVQNISAQSILTVTNNNNNGIGSLRQTIFDAQDGDSIIFNGAYTIMLESALQLGEKTIIINGLFETDTVSIDGGWIDINNDYIDDDSSFTRCIYIKGVPNKAVNIYNLKVLFGGADILTYGTDTASMGGGLFADMKDGGELLVSGCSFSGNVAISDSVSAFGAGIYIGGGGVFSSCSIVNNKAKVSHKYGNDAHGGGIYINGEGEVTNCLIESNSADAHGTGYGFGGGAYIEKGIISNCSVLHNTASGNDAYGGGIYSSNGIISNSSASNNTVVATDTGAATVYVTGGGVYAINKSVFDNGQIRNNRSLASSSSEGVSAAYGGGIILYSGSEIRNSIVSGNIISTDSTYEYGGGIYLVSSGTASINNQIIGNSARFGGGIASYGNCIVNNCDILSNYGDTTGGIYGTGADGGAGAVYVNNVLWNNTSLKSEVNILTISDFSYNAIPGGYSGNGAGIGIVNLLSNPFVREPSAGDDGIWGTLDDDLGNLHLINGAQCIDAGLLEISHYFDFEGNPRFQGASIDIGAYESNGVIPGGDFVDNRVYVDTNTTGEDNGESWANALNNLTTAIYVAVVNNIHEIWIADGIYKPSSSNRYQSFTLSENLSVYGGFSGGETLLSERALSDKDEDGIIEPWEFTYETVLSGDIGVENDSTDNTLRIVYTPSGDNSATLLDGVTVTKAYASLGGFLRGAGMYVFGGNYNNCIVKNNMVYSSNPDRYSSGGYGAGVFAINKPSFTHCSINNNIVKCLGAKNYAFGAGLYSTSDCEILACEFVNNTTIAEDIAKGGGGGIYFSSTARCRASYISRNTSLNGGGVYANGGVFENCKIIGNTASENGGGIFHNNSSIISCNITGNLANNGGGVYTNIDGDLVNCTIYGNEAFSGSGIFANNGGSFKNTILWNNSSAEPNSEIKTEGNGMSFEYNAMASEYSGEGAGEGMLTLIGSPFVAESSFGIDNIWGTKDDSISIELNRATLCVNNGTPNVLNLNLPTTDLAGNKRIIDVVDMGALESVFKTPIIVKWPDAGVISYGQTISANGLERGNATTEGEFIFLVDSVMLHLGSYTTPIAFIPTDTLTYINIYDSALYIVAKAELIIEAENKSKVFGESDPEFTFLFSGFVNNEESEVLLSLPTISVEEPHNNAGSYVISVEGGEADNYSFKYHSGSFTIEKAVPTVFVWPSATDIFQGEKLKQSTLEDGSVSISGGFNFEDNTIIPASVGNYDAIVVFTPNDIVNYARVQEFVVVNVKAKENTGLEGQNMSAISVYPNPAINWVSVEMPINSTIAITNINGKVLFANKTTSRITKIELSEYSNGTYIVSAVFKGKLVTKVLIIKT